MLWIVSVSLGIAVIGAIGVLLFIESDIAPVICGGIVAVGVILFFATGAAAIVASQQARVMNERFDTDYTAEEMFFAGEIIREQIEGSRHRVEIE